MRRPGSLSLLSPHDKERHLQVLVRDNNVEQALKVLKRKMQREGMFREMKQRRFYEKPSEKLARERGQAVRRRRKLARKQAERDEVSGASPAKKTTRGAGMGAPRSASFSR
jgi:small subunit ribosomal protein S21